MAVGGVGEDTEASTVIEDYLEPAMKRSRGDAADILYFDQAGDKDPYLEGSK